VKGEEIYQLIPQRPPIVMVDVVYAADEASAETGLTIQEDNIFVRNGRFREPGLIEHIAQSAAAFAGYGTFARGEEPKLGYIGEIKDCNLFLLPKAGDELRTTIRLVTEVVGIRLIAAETKVNGEAVASCQMKIFLKEE
jgi:predicted hotdog family 3-hydroxylacyl-ACP dehydratase